MCAIGAMMPFRTNVRTTLAERIVCPSTKLDKHTKRADKSDN